MSILVSLFIVGCKLVNVDVLAAIDELPLTNSPEVFGLHPNAEIGYYTQATKEMWSILIELQPQTGIYIIKNVKHYLYLISLNV